MAQALAPPAMLLFAFRLVSELACAAGTAIVAAPLRVEAEGGTASGTTNGTAFFTLPSWYCQ